MCVSILNTRNELLKRSDTNERRYQSYLKWLYRFGCTFGKDWKKDSIIVDAWGLYDWILHPGGRYGFWTKSEELLSKSWHQRIKDSLDIGT